MAECFWSLYNQRDKTRFDGLKTGEARRVVSKIQREQVVDWLAWKEGTPEWVSLSEHTELFMPADDTASQIEIGEGLSEKSKTVISQVTRSKLTNPTVSHPDFDFGDPDLAAESEFNQSVTEPSDPGVDTSEDQDLEGTATNTKSFQHLDVRHMPEPRPVASSHPKPEVPDAGVDRVFHVDEMALEIDAGIDDGELKQDLRKSTRYRRKIDAEIDLGGQLMAAKTVNLSMGGCQIDRPLPDASKRQVKMTLTKGKDKLLAICQVVVEKDGQPSTRFRFLDIDRIDLLRTWLISPG